LIDPTTPRLDRRLVKEEEGEGERRGEEEKKRRKGKDRQEGKKE
jgi:hypothetical protein